MLTVAEEAHKTDTGRQRHANEDSYFARPPLFAVADGMGGAQAGEVASRIAAGAFERRGQLSDDAPAEGQLEEIAQRANREIHRLAQEDSSHAGMGTTLTAAMVRDDEVAFGHVGDSRAYVYRDGQLKRLTKDHSLVEELRRQGRLTEEQAEEHPQRSIITRALGPEPSVNVDTMTFPAKNGDVFLLCSDGLTTMVSDDEIRQILGEARSLRSAVNKLVDAANRGGGRDNITAVAFRLADADAKEGEESATLIARTAETAGLTGERVRAATDRIRGRGPMPAPSRRRRLIGIGQPEGHRGDVVPAAPVVRRVDEPVDGASQAPRVDEDVPDLVIRDHRGEAVAAEQEDVAVARREGHGVDVHARLRPQGARDDRALRMLLRLFLGEPALAAELLDERVVLRQALELA
ncbi:MAG: Stp1/IreP family PP2C-type Ser/Thr phosphatase, partial [Solirubrobacterales bacterium]